MHQNVPSNFIPSCPRCHMHTLTVSAKWKEPASLMEMIRVYCKTCHLLFDMAKGELSGA
jgi:hypothetical protein